MSKLIVIQCVGREAEVIGFVLFISMYGRRYNEHQVVRKT